MLECSRQENTSFLSPLTESSSHQEIGEPTVVHLLMIGQ